ncbi:MAG: Rieske 2Fe-2S domain-containing protein [Gammaproteobacteria bacterium]|nr:Rieske 2Fe-2S domain-containing protein [Gammaproteobacteria bacterium]MDH5691899.1 Rieske 2Fe-2S domain-containing protein [Gammaproteobacteria bacterium]
MTSRLLCKKSQLEENLAIGIDSLDDPNVQEFVVIMRDGQVYAYENKCPHTGVSMNWQPNEFMDLDGFYLQCSIHGAKFQVEDGFCVWGPCAQQSLNAVSISLQGDDVFLTD